jgi:hypothetical protein
MKFLRLCQNKRARVIFSAYFHAVFRSGNLFAGEKSKNSGTAKTTRFPRAPKITQVDGAGLKNILKRTANLCSSIFGRRGAILPRRVSDLVKIDADYKNKIDFITVSLDESKN